MAKETDRSHGWRRLRGRFAGLRWSQPRGGWPSPIHLRLVPQRYGAVTIRLPPSISTLIDMQRPSGDVVATGGAANWGARLVSRLRYRRAAGGPPYLENEQGVFCRPYAIGHSIQPLSRQGRVSRVSMRLSKQSRSPERIVRGLGSD